MGEKYIGEPKLLVGCGEEESDISDSDMPLL